MPRLVLHPGFHKTGTSSAQHLLWRNRKRLLSHVEIYQFRHLTEVGALALKFSKSGNPLDLLDLADLLDAVFAGIGPKEGRHLLLSHEGLFGHLPGWPGVADYGAAQVLLPIYLEFLADRFPGHVLQVVLTTRSRDSWIWSAWRHHLYGHRLTQSFEAFEAEHHSAADLTALAADLRAKVAPVEVVEADLADAAAHPLGPAGALLDPLDLPDAVADELVIVPPGNRGPNADLAAQFLALNRCALPDGEVRIQKDRLATAAGVGGWARP